MALRYYYQLDLYGNPIPGSNVALIKKPTFLGKKRLVEFTPLGKLAPCCEDGDDPFVSTGRKWRYFIRMSETTNLPISGTLERRRFKPRGYRFQEVDGDYCCS